MKNLFSKNEYSELDKVLREISKEFGTQFSFNSLVNSWKTFVFRCESGYSDCIDEYLNDISVREILYFIRKRVGVNLSNKINKILDPLDSSFLSVTNPIKDPLINLPEGQEEIHNLLYFRVPKKLIGDLKEDINFHLMRQKE